MLFRSNVSVKVNDVDITRQINAISVDTAPDINREPKSDDCIKIPDEWIYLYGPGKTTIQITAYPLEGDPGAKDYTLGLQCAATMSLSVPWKYVYDCRLESDCFLSDGSLGKKKGKWVGIPMKKKQVTVTGDISGADKLFVIDGCGISAPKFSIQANQFGTYMAQETTQYTHLKYTGTPVSFDSDQLDSPFKVSVTAQEGCGGFSDVDAYLTGFSLNYTPPQAPTITYNFETLFSVCPGNC